jgi:RHS repeat-associated protein
MQRFASKELNVETGLDYFLARYYSPAQGRFTSVDPGGAGANLGDPQSWNGYAYARNNPGTYGDPDGRTYKLCTVDGKCTEYSDQDVDAWRKQDGVIFKKGDIFDGGGNRIGTYERTWFDDQTDQFNRMFLGVDRMAPAMKKTILAVTAANLTPAVIGIGSGALGGSSLTSLGLSGGGTTISGLYGSTTVAALESLASSGGSTVEVVTNLTQAPAAGQALSVATGENAAALANQAGALRGAGQLFTARIPKALLDELIRVGLARQATTSMTAAGVRVTATEIEFSPVITKFIVGFFR